MQIIRSVKEQWAYGRWDELGHEGKGLLMVALEIPVDEIAINFWEMSYESRAKITDHYFRHERDVIEPLTRSLIASGAI